MVKNLPANAGDLRDAGSVPGSGRSHGGVNGNPLQYPCLGNPMDKGAWRAAVHGVTKSQTRLSTHTSSTRGGFYSLLGGFLARVVLFFLSWVSFQVLIFRGIISIRLQI